MIDSIIICLAIGICVLLILSWYHERKANEKLQDLIDRSNEVHWPLGDKNDE